MIHLMEMEGYISQGGTKFADTSRRSIQLKKKEVIHVKRRGVQDMLP